MGVAEQVAGHYGRPGLEQDVLTAVAEAGLDLDHLRPLDLAEIDEFHLGGLETMRSLLAELDLGPGRRLLDVGSGIGGPARLAAAEFGCPATGVDLTPEFVETARTLTRLVGLEDQVVFETADAAALPFAEGAFDRATMIHVGMNLPDKASVFAEVRRVLEPDGLFLIFDQMLTGDAEPDYPVPWAAEASASFLETPARYRELLGEAGFTVDLERDLTHEGVAFFERMRAEADAAGGPPALGLHVMFGAEWPQRVAHDAAALVQGVLTANVVVARAT
ncbi:SAM-dependent methyltransferase [Nocardioides donggukensis]|uniref:Methyltransferase domain-containing protein n=1 Tax=Nocardioides donggukensis TaxID=2774019 RepID=A0A927K5B2_9ACTN|nr:class I SAM-dependent methyltransferase [Nocardioides donggukensis]MBD8869405.1 methyltransferase domain-containing protein [Nocardioides donggukensis]